MRDKQLREALIRSGIVEEISGMFSDSLTVTCEVNVARLERDFRLLMDHLGLKASSECRIEKKGKK
jgi:hypothetical protein